MVAAATVLLASKLEFCCKSSVLVRYEWDVRIASVSALVRSCVCTELGCILRLIIFSMRDLSVDADLGKSYGREVSDFLSLTAPLLLLLLLLPLFEPVTLLPVCVMPRVCGLLAMLEVTVDAFEEAVELPLSARLFDCMGVGIEDGGRGLTDVLAGLLIEPVAGASVIVVVLVDGLLFVLFATKSVLISLSKISSIGVIALALT